MLNKNLEKYKLEIIELYKTNQLNTTQICQKYNIPSSTLSYFFKRNNIEILNNGKQSMYIANNLDLIKHKIKILWEKGYSLKQIEKELKIPSTTFRRFNLHKEVDTTYYQDRYAIDKNHNFFKNIDSEIKAYLLGILYTDGCVSSKKFSVKLGVQLRDQYLVDLIKQYISPFSNIKKSKIIKKENNKQRIYFEASININSKHLHKDLCNLGVVPRKTYIKSSLPKIPKEFMRHYIRGCFDGDGCVYLNKKRVVVSFTGEPNFIQELKDYLVKELDLNNNKIYVKPKQYDNCFQFSAKKDTKSFQDFIYNDSIFYLDRKFKKFAI